MLVLLELVSGSQVQEEQVKEFSCVKQLTIMNYRPFQDETTIINRYNKIANHKQHNMCKNQISSLIHLSYISLSFSL